MLSDMQTACDQYLVMFDDRGESELRARRQLRRGSRVAVGVLDAIIGARAGYWVRVLRGKEEVVVLMEQVVGYSRGYGR